MCARALGFTGRLGCPAKRRRMFFNGSLFLPAGDRAIVGVDYRMVNATSGMDIGVPPFSPARFPEVREGIHLVGGRVIIQRHRHSSA